MFFHVGSCKNDAHQQAIDNLARILDNREGSFSLFRVPHRCLPPRSVRVEEIQRSPFCAINALFAQSIPPTTYYPLLGLIRPYTGWTNWTKRDGETKDSSDERDEECKREGSCVCVCIYIIYIYLYTYVYTYTYTFTSYTYIYKYIDTFIYTYIYICSTNQPTNQSSSQPTIIDWTLSACSNMRSSFHRQVTKESLVGPEEESKRKNETLRLMYSFRNIRRISNIFTDIIFFE